MLIQEPDAPIAEMQRRLVDRGVLEPLSHDEALTTAWLDHELATWAENRLGLVVDPWAVSDADRPEWLRRATGTEKRHSPHRRYETPYWIVSRGTRLGTVALSKMRFGVDMPNLTNLYIHPAQRRRGHAHRVLDAIFDAALKAGLGGIRLQTEWCWQPAVRLYAAAAMWVCGWKRELVFARNRELPDWSLRIEADEARFMLEERGTGDAIIAITARKEGERLLWTQNRALQTGSRASQLAAGTFALALALQGWPLITSESEWQKQARQGWSDCGGPEALAFKIRLWEAWARHNGWRVASPRIPGLDYPSWAELEGAGFRR